MPRKQINDYIFYKIVNINNDVDLCYVGSTCNWKGRIKCHRQDCNNPNSKKHNLKIYRIIREYGGWDEFKMLEIGRTEQLTLTEAHQKEEEYRIELKANMNAIKCYLSKEDSIEYNRIYHIQNKERENERSRNYLIDYRKQPENLIKQSKSNKLYIINNPEKCKEIYKKRREKIVCECGCEIVRDSSYRHIKTKKHIDLMEQINTSLAML